MTDEQKLRAREKRLLKTYGISLAQYEEILKAQNGCCAICGRPATDFSINLSVDHRHFRVKTEKLSGKRGGAFSYAKWVAFVREFDVMVTGKVKSAVIAEARRRSMPFSVRGLLCPGRHGPAGTCCNRNLGRVDNPDWLHKALSYLENPPARKVLDLP